MLISAVRTRRKEVDHKIPRSVSSPRHGEDTDLGITRVVQLASSRTESTYVLYRWPATLFDLIRRKAARLMTRPDTLVGTVLCRVGSRGRRHPPEMGLPCNRSGAARSPISRPCRLSAAAVRRCISDRTGPVRLVVYRSGRPRCLCPHPARPRACVIVNPMTPSADRCAAPVQRRCACGLCKARPAPS